MASRDNLTIMRKQRILVMLVLSVVASALTGCCSLPFGCPSGEKVIAAREQGRLGLDALARGRLDEAQMRMQAALEDCPHDDQLRRDYAQVLWKQNRRDEAKAQMAVALNGTSNSEGVSDGEATWLVEYGRMAFVDGDPATAIQSVDRAINLNPDSAAAWKLRGDIMRSSQQLDDSIANYHRALTLGADENATLLDLADAYRLQGRPRRALSTLQRLGSATAAGEEPPRLAGMQAAALQALGRHEDAIGYFAKAVDRNNRDPELLYMMAVSQSSVGDHDSAFATASQAAGLSPADERIRTLLVGLDRQRATPLPNSGQSEVMLTSNEVPVSR